MPTTVPETYPANQGGYTAPSGYSVDNNIAQAQAYAASHTVAETYQWFRDQVQNKGPWDYKQQGPYEGLGNWNYGAVGSAIGIPEPVLQRMAGWAQWKAGTSKPEWGNPLGGAPYGDDPLDQQAINGGIQWTRNNYPTPPLLIPDAPLHWPGMWVPAPVPVSQETNTSYMGAAAWTPPRDPLVLDLDGDGIEATAIDTAAPILFDHNADGSQTATGWIKPDDGIVVMDLNGNGTIDTGRELFGDNTLLPDGSKAANGFEAIAQYDANADGKIDSADAAYAQLRIWQDANQDGVSQAGELKTLAELGIASINVIGEASDITLGNGNSQPWSGTFTRTNGSTGDSGTPELSGSLLLASNNFYREFTDNPELTEAAMDLPQMRASGWVRDLREAMSLGTTQAQALQDLVTEFAAATTRDDQMALLDDLISAWGMTTGRMLTSVYEYTILALDANTRTTFDYQAEHVGQQGWTFLTLHPQGLEETVWNGSNHVTRPTAEGMEFLRHLNVLEAFNGDKFIQIPIETSGGGLGSGSGGGSGGSGGTAGNTYLSATLSATQVNLLQQSYDSLLDSIYSALLVQTRLRPYLDSIGLVIDETGLSFDASGLEARLDTLKQADERNALIDLIELNQYAQPTLQAVNFDGLTKLQGWIDALPADSALRTELADGQDIVYDFDTSADNFDRLIFKAGVLPADVQVSRVYDHLILKIAGTTDQVQINNYFSGDGAGGWALEAILFRDDPETSWSVADVKELAIIGGAANDTLVGYAGDDEMVGNAGNDNLSGHAGQDTLHGGLGDDTLYGEAGHDLLVGDEGNDELQGGAGDDTFDGGAGNDVMSGHYHNTFHGWYGGAGNDTYLFGRGDGQDVIYDPDGSAGMDKVAFKAGVAPADVEIIHSADHLILRIIGTSDQVRIHNYFSDDATTGWVIEEIRFTDDPSTVWSVGDVKARALTGGVGNDTLIGYAANDEIVGNAGDDTVYGRAGDDAINGGAGDDALYGELGDDTLAGDIGNDSLRGEAGQDRLLGQEGTDILQGGAGDDVVDGGAGSDILAGGFYDTWSGNYDGVGNDTYLFGRGDGADAIYDKDATPGSVDKIVFKMDVLPSEVTVARSGINLILGIAGTSDSLTVVNCFYGGTSSEWAIEEVRFTSEPSTVWTIADVKSRLLTGGDGNDLIDGYAGDDNLFGNGGNDTLRGADGNDGLNGGAGADFLRGENGDDVLNGDADADILHGGAGGDTVNGGAGNDTLIGGHYDGYWNTYSGAGNDTYLFGVGDGQDVVYDNDSAAGNLDKILFKAGVLPANVKLVRVGNDLVLQINGTADQLTVKSYFGTGTTSDWAIEEIRFTDSATVWNVSYVNSQTFTGGAGNDTLTGFSTNDTLYGNDGNDTLWGRDGNDLLDGGNGNDAMDGENGDDTLLGGTGADTLAGGAGADVLRGDAEADNLQGGTGNDTLEGNAGNDVLNGGYYDGYWNTYNGAGNDTYLFGRGDGQDVVYDADTTAGNLDKLTFKSGVLPADIQLSRSGLNVILKIAGTTDQVTVVNYFHGDGTGGWALEEIGFTDSTATVWNVAAVKAAVLSGTSGNDTLIGYASSDAVNGYDGGDSISGRDGNDTLDGGNGNDALDGENGDDSLLGGAGADTVTGSAGADVLRGGSEADSLQGGTGNDTLEGNAGNDALNGGYYDGYWNTYNGAGNDTYLFGRGDGQDTVYDNDTTGVTSTSSRSKPACCPRMSNSVAPG